MSLLRAESFSCSLDVLYEILGISKLQFFQKDIEKNFSCIFIQFLVIKTPDPDSEPNADPEPDADPDSVKCWIRIRIRIRIHNTGTGTY